MSSQKRVYYIAGVTCAGKDYFIEHCLEKYPHLYDAVQVGKIFRQRYPAGHFKGSAAPDHTEREAIEIYNEELAKAFKTDKPYVLVAGQPRRLSQIEPTILKHPGQVLWLHCDKETQADRINRRFADDLEGRQLALARISNDKIDLYDIIWAMMGMDIEIEPCTSEALIDFLAENNGHLEYAPRECSHLPPFSLN